MGFKKFMVKLSQNINADLADELDMHFDEIQHENWTIERPNNAELSPSLIGYFEDESEAKKNFKLLQENFDALAEHYLIETVIDADWQNAYKEFLKPWHCGNLHWIPVWLKDEYPLSEGDKAFYFDAGMAFGTGDHPTTRLCAVAMQDYVKENPNFASKYVIDAGCGSGILAISAALLGFENIYGFDIDADSIRVCLENAAYNNTNSAKIRFETGTLQSSLKGDRADLLLANIQADVLSQFADELIAAVADGGVLVLSGILHYENAEVKTLFEAKIGGKLKESKADFMGDWSSLVLKFR